MPNCFHAQRQHIISSLDTLLYQLHSLSFFFAPSLLSFVCRIAVHATKPRDDDISHTLRFYLILVILLNLPSLWYHTTYSPAEDRAVVLDFVGLAYTPSKLQLVTLDITILILQLILTTIAYETSLSVNSSEPDFLAPLPLLELPSQRMEVKDIYAPQYVLDLRFKAVLSRLRHPPAKRPPSTNSSVPIPNTTTWSLPSSVGIALVRAGRRARTGGNNGRPFGTPDTQRVVRGDGPGRS